MPSGRDSTSGVVGESRTPAPAFESELRAFGVTFRASRTHVQEDQLDIMPSSKEATRQEKEIEEEPINR